MISVVAHRGDSESARENTPESIRAAIEAGADWVELDLQLTRDGACVVLHDDTLLRLWGLPRRTRELDLEKLSAPGHGECRIPTLSEALALVASLAGERPGGVGVMLDVVDPEVATRAARVVARACDEQPLRVQWCGSVAAMTLVREDLPTARIVHNHPGGRAGPGPGGAAGIGGGQRGVDPAGRAAGGPGAPPRPGRGLWTVDDAETMSWLIDLGVDAITTNRPRLARRLLAGGTSPLALVWDGLDTAATRWGLPPELMRWTAVARELAVWANGFTPTAALGQVAAKARTTRTW